jgi:hypothetical protein
VRRPILPLAALLPALLSCTAMGAWLYDDPSFALRSVTVRRTPAGAASGDSLDLVFVACNRNDYDLLGEGFTTLLAVSGRTIGEGAREQPVLLATRDTSSFTVTVPLQRQNLATNVLRAPFQLSSHSMVRTPMGDRPVVFSLHGRVDLTDTSAQWSTERAPDCHPGASQLPGLFDRRVPLGPPAAEPQGPQVGPGTGGNNPSN